MDERIIIGTRSSKLALMQVDEFKREMTTAMPDIEFGVKTYLSPGDRDKITPIYEAEDNYFTRDLEEALLKEEIDIVLHSAKDIPGVIPSGVMVGLLTKGLTDTDSLVSKNNLKLKDLPAGSKIGVSSKRRQENIKKLRADLNTIPIRGNIEERLNKLDKGEYEAIIVATCALKRLNLEERISEEFTQELFSPHPLQGKLGAEVKEDNLKLIKVLNKIDSRKKILFVCIENSCRSQMAQALLNHFYWQKTVSFSAGSSPSGNVNSMAIEVMKEKGIDISDQKSKGFSEIEGVEFDYIITLGCGDTCPFYPGRETIDWNLEDPKGREIDFFRRIRDEIEEKIAGMVQQLHTGKEELN